MTQQYLHVATGQIFRIPARGVITVAGQQVGPYTSEVALLALGCMRHEPPPPAPVPSDADLLATQYAALRADHAAGFAAVRAELLAVGFALGQAGQSLPDPLTFRSLFALLASLDGDQWTRAAVTLRVAYDEVLFATGDMQTADRLVPAIMADTTL